MLPTSANNSLLKRYILSSYYCQIADACERRWVETELYWRECPPDHPIFSTDEQIKKLTPSRRIQSYVNWNENCSLQMLEWYLRREHGSHLYFKTGFLYHVDGKSGAPYKQIYNFIQFISDMDSILFRSIQLCAIERTPKSAEDAKFKDKLVQLGFTCKNISFKNINCSPDSRKYYEDIFRFSQLLKN